MEDERLLTKKKLSHLADFSCWRGLAESDEKREFVMKIIFQTMLNKVLGSCKADQEIKLVTGSYITFHTELPAQNLKCIVK